MRCSALFTDLYELTMLQSYVRDGMHGTAAFDLFVRRLRARNYLLACGLDAALSCLEEFRFEQEELAYLSSLPQLAPDFIDWLAGLRFTGDVYAVPEGTPVFANEPLLEIVAPLPEAQLVETALLNRVSFATNVASKAARVVHAAAGRPVAEFGMRRLHGIDAAMQAARAAYVAGVDTTSNVQAGFELGIGVSGTMAHSFVQVHESEAEAFDTFARLYPRTTLLVDTYDTLAAIDKAISLYHRLPDDRRFAWVRLDSGDLMTLSRA
ncbi:MAG TPA: nicotinate phosphoribosyltransferase, partial [Rhodothermales bacterium]